ncbi:helix-turn-helix transcriptional regulator [Nocardioides sp. WV_118_6]|uniref:helix-turn-helix domain-containing protein n=1 Tax=Nocardioides simplex TaxID=2045 RepID=UPI00214FEAA9|nr:helix-turn-helix transcriptional regulator [Pimelobacter simplex]UUW90829.1 helix-turn-helix domain-containing protein [Pimelobacter simplex]UUW94658.1 helix-turn-helix domain-containing protein [Pimelobacter simplex]
MNEARIKDLRAARGWSQERLAEASGVAVRTIQRLEAGNDASLETLSMVAKALEVSVRDLFVTVDDDRMSVAVDGLDARLAAERAARSRAEWAHRGWRYLYVALGLLVTAAVLIVVGSPDSTGEAILVVPAYWLGGLLLLRFLERSVLRPRLDARYPLTAEDAR